MYQFIFQLTSFLDLKIFNVRNNRQNKFSKLYRKLRWLIPYNTTVVELLAFICSYKYLLVDQRCMFFAPNEQSLLLSEARTSGLENLVLSRQTGFSSASLHLLIRPMVLTEPAIPSARNKRPGFETISQQHAVHAQQRSYSGHAESFSNTPKSSKRKKG